jgi:hypothetical protein
VRGLGYKPDLDDERDGLYALKAHHLPVASPPPEADCLQLFAGLPLDQDGQNSCIAQVIAQAIRAAHVRAGHPDPPLISRHDVWYKYRFRRGWHQQNEGGYIRDGFHGINDTGFCQEKHWPHDLSLGPDAPYLLQPPTIAQQHCEDQRNKSEGRVSYRRLTEVGDARIERLQQCVASKLPPVFGTDVGSPLTDGAFDPNKPLGPPEWEDIQGGHAMICGAYRGSDFFVRTSWGPFALAGWFWMNAAYVQQWRDIWLVDAAPYFSELLP